MASMKIISEPSRDSQGGFFGLKCNGCGQVVYVDTRMGEHRVLALHSGCKEPTPPK